MAKKSLLKRNNDLTDIETMEDPEFDLENEDVEQNEDVSINIRVKETKKPVIKEVKKPKKITSSQGDWLGFTPNDIIIKTEVKNGRVIGINVKDANSSLASGIKYIAHIQTFGEVFQECLRILRERINANSN